MEPNKNGCGQCPGCPRVSRRTVLGALGAAINVAVVGAIAGPVAGFIASPLRRGKSAGKWLPVMAAEGLREGETRAVNYQVAVDDGYMTSQRIYSAYVQRKRGRITAYDPTCPHLGCHVEYRDRKRRFVCPCHGGTFDEDGNLISGPPPHGLTKIAAKVEAGQIWLYKV